MMKRKAQTEPSNMCPMVDRKPVQAFQSLRLTRRAVMRLAVVSAVQAVATACQVRAPQVGTVLDQLLKTTVVAKGQAAPGAREAIKAISTLKPPLWIVLKRELFSAYNIHLSKQIQDLCREQGLDFNLSYCSDYVGTSREVERIAAAVRAGDPPDVILSNLKVFHLHQSKSLQPVTELVTEMQAKWGPAAPKMVRDYYIDQEWWAVPFYQRSDGGWYRKDIWDRAGIDIQSLRTYPELLEACLSLSRPKEELYGWGVTINRCENGDAFIDRVITGWGGHWQDETGRYVTIASPETIAALNWLADLYTHPRWQKMLPPDVLSWTDSSNNEAYLAGKLIYTQNSGSLYAEALLSENPLAEVTGFHPLAGGPKLREFHGLNASAWMFPRNAANPNLALSLVRQLMQTIEQFDTVFAAAPGFALPAYIGLWEKSTYLPTNPLAMQQKPPATDPLGITPWFHPGPVSSAMIHASFVGIRNDMVQTILKGGLAVEAVQAAHQRMVEIFREFGLPGEKEEPSR